MAIGFTATARIPDFRRQLAELGRRMERKVVVDAIRFGAGAVFREQARKEAPVLREPDSRRQRGALKRAIFVGRSRFGKRGTVLYYVGVRSRPKLKGRPGDPFYWQFLESGWSPRPPGKALKGGRRRKALERRRAASRGARRYAYPYLRPAFEHSQGAALKAFEARMETGLRKAAERL